MRRGAAFLALAALASVALVAAGCSSASSSTATSSSTVPLPAGRFPSKIATMVCQPKAAGEIEEVLGVKAVVTDRTWVDHLYSCDYRYTTGTMVLSVKELSSWGQTLAYFGGLARTMHRTMTIDNLGQGAFQVADGSVVVRKDWKILVVDTTGLPSQFGVPPTSSGDVAVTVAEVILGCWAGD